MQFEWQAFLKQQDDAYTNISHHAMSLQNWDQISKGIATVYGLRLIKVSLRNTTGLIKIQYMYFKAVQHFELSAWVQCYYKH